MNRNKYKNCVLQHLSSEHIILKFYYKIVKCFYWIKNSIFYEIIITVFQFTQRAIENRFACHAWHTCRRLQRPGINNVSRDACGSFDALIVWERSRLRHCAKSRKVADSIPEGVVGIFHRRFRSCRTMALESTQPLTEMSTRNISCGVKAVSA
jgi:hypothetical protein